MDVTRAITEDMPEREPMRPRRECRVHHAKRRAAQRFGVSLSDLEIAGFVESLRTRTATFVHRLDRGRSLWEVQLRGRPVRVVYDHAHEELVTVLPDTSRIAPPRTCA